MRFQKMSSQRDRSAGATAAQLLAQQLPAASLPQPSCQLATDVLRHASICARRAPSRAFVRARPSAIWICRAGANARPDFSAESRSFSRRRLPLSTALIRSRTFTVRALQRPARVLRSTLPRHIVTAVSSRLPRLFPSHRLLHRTDRTRRQSKKHGHESDQAHSKTQRGGAKVGHDCELARPGEPFLELFVGPPQQPAPRSTGC